MDELEKLKYHVRLLGECLSLNDYPVESMIISFDLSEADMKDLHDIFEKHDKILKGKKKISSPDMEADVHSRFGFSYQDMKTIVNALFRNGQWQSVCRAYAKSFEPAVPIELQAIAKS